MARHSFLIALLLSSSIVCGMYRQIPANFRVQEQALDEIKSIIVGSLSVCHQIAQTHGSAKRLSLVKNDANQTPLIDNSADFLAEQKVNRHLKKVRYQYDPYTHSPQDWYNGLPMKIQKELAKKIKIDREKIKLAFPKKQLFS